jgi:hypothetical protein
MEETLSSRKALEVRKVIERAKDILMTEMNIDGEKAPKLVVPASERKGAGGCKEERSSGVVRFWGAPRGKNSPQQTDSLKRWER